MKMLLLVKRNLEVITTKIPSVISNGNQFEGDEEIPDSEDLTYIRNKFGILVKRVKGTKYNIKFEDKEDILSLVERYDGINLKELLPNRMFDKELIEIVLRKAAFDSDFKFDKEKSLNFLDLPKINELEISDPRIYEVAEKILAGEALIDEGRFYIDEDGNFGLSADARVLFSNFVPGGIKLSRDAIHHIMSAAYFGFMLNIGRKTLQYFIARQIKIQLYKSGSSGNFCIHVCYDENKFVRIRVEPCIQVIASDPDLMSNILKRGIDGS